MKVSAKMMVQNAPEAAATRTSLIFASILALMIFSAYSNTFDARPVLDDFHSFIEEPLVRMDDLNTNTLWGLKESKFGRARWIPMATLSIDLWAGKGHELFNLHLTNLVIHLSCFLSLLFLVKLLCKASAGTYSHDHERGAGLFVPLWVAGLWALHPVQTNAVTYIVQRMASLVALFTILSVAFYVLGRLTSKNSVLSKWKSLLCYAFSLLAMVMAFYSKENSAMIPPVLLFTEYWFFSPDLCRSAFLYIRKHWITSTILFSISFIIAGYLFNQYILNAYGGRHFSLIERLMTESRIVFWYLSMVLWPTAGRLSLEHDVVLSRSLIDPPSTILALLGLCIMVVFIFAYRKKYPLVTYGMLWFLLNLVIESSFIPLELIFEHRMYLPSAGLLLSVIVLIYGLAEKFWKKSSSREFTVTAWCCFAILTSVLSLSTFQRNEIWRDPLALARDNAEKAPGHPRARANLAVALGRHGHFEDSIREAEIAISLGIENFEQHAVALNAMIKAYSNLGEHRKALDYAERFLADKGDQINAGALPSVYMNLALAEDALGNLPGAFEQTTRALYAFYHMQGFTTDLRDGALAYLSDLLSRAQETSTDLDGDGQADPGSVSKEFWISRRLLAFGDQAAAMRLLKNAAVDDRDAPSRALLEALVRTEELNAKQVHRNFGYYSANPNSRFNAAMAIAFTLQKRKHLKPLSPLGEALLDYALELRPDSADAHLLKAWYHRDRDRVDEAIEEVKIAIQLDPEHARAWLALGLFLSSTKNYPEAIEAFNKTLELYPGLPQRTAISDLIANAREAIQPKMESERRMN
jgi:tetratricopeptide (TPR) repeat protein